MKKFALFFVGALALASVPAALLSLHNNTHAAFADSGSGTLEDPYIVSTFKGLHDALNHNNVYIVVNEFETDHLDECGYYTPTKEDLPSEDATRYFDLYAGYKINLTINCDIKIKQSDYHKTAHSLFGGGGFNQYIGKKANITLDGNGTLAYKVNTKNGGVNKAILNTISQTDLTINGNLTFLPDTSNAHFAGAHALQASKDSNVTINGGTFYCSNYDMYFPCNSFFASLYGEEENFTINGGKFLLGECNSANKPIYGLEIYPDNASKYQNFKIYGGEFEGICSNGNKFDLNSVLAPGYQYVLDDDSVVEDGVFATQAHMIVKPVPGYDYTVTFDPNGGTGTMEPVPVHTKFYTLPDCEFTNADDSLLFRGWKLSTDSEELYAPGESVELGVDTTFYASWSEKDIYEVKYDDGKGNCIVFNSLEGSSFNVRTFESTGFKAPVGKSFNYWLSKWTSEAVYPNDSYIIPDDNTYFIAQYISTGQTVCRLDFDNSGGTGEMDSVEVIAGTFYTLPANTEFSKGSAPFRGWNVGSYGLKNPYDSVFVRGNMAISAVWGEPVDIDVKPITPYTIGKVNISFDNIEAYVVYDDGTKDRIDPQNDLNFYVLNEQQEYELIPFLPNYYPGDNITAHIKAVHKNDIALESEFDIHYGNYCFLSFDPNLEDQDTFVEYYVYGETTYLPEFPYELPDGLEFSGWRDVYGASHPAKQEVTVDSSAYYMANINGADYTITLDHGLGSGKMDDRIAYYNSNFYLPKPTFTAPSGYEFDHWEIEGETYQASVKYTFTWTKDITATAIYREKEAAICVITYDANGGSKDVLPITVSEGSTYKLPKGDIFDAPDGYEFDYWEVTIGNTAPKNLNPNQSFDVSEDVKIKAIWKEITKYTITFNSNGGSGTMEDVVKPEGSSYTLPDNGFTAPEHHHFLGWSYSDTGSIISDPSITINDNITLYAIWGIDSHTITFTCSGGATGTMDPVNKEYGSEYTLPTPTFTPDSGKEFKHWEINGVEVLTSSITITGDVTLNAVYGDIPTSPVLKSITLSGTYKTTFTVGDSFTSEGLVVTAHYDGKEDAIVNTFTVDSSKVDMNKAGEYTVTVSYTEEAITKTTTYKVKVNDKDVPVPPEPPVNPDTPTKPDKGGLPAGAVVGIVVGSVAVTAGIGVGVFFLLKKKGIILKK